jgi:2,3-bisphosphoglycerate-independent phosphoglycerate mutase
MERTLPSPLAAAVRAAYGRGEDDETLNPLVLEDLAGVPEGRIAPGDSVIFYNIRGEREIELTRSLTEKEFSEFPVREGMNLCFATMIEYARGLSVDVAFPPVEDLRDTLGQVLSARGLPVLKITEAEKATHVGYFFNGKSHRLFPGEKRIIVPTRKDVALFDEAPEMSIGNVTETVLGELETPSHPFVLVNFPNVDVVGHIENEGAAIRAVEIVDEHLGRVLRAAEKGRWTVIVTADHGTVEKWLYPDGAVDTGHTDSPVPFFILAPGDAVRLRKTGELTDIAPTVLHLFGIPKPPAMTGTTLLEGSVPPDGGDGRRILLVILDGWGHREDPRGNLIARARTPVMDGLREKGCLSVLEAAGSAVGLPPGTVGNSEAGHLHIGAGRRIPSDRVLIRTALEDGSFFRNPAFTGAVRTAAERGTALHLMGIVSFFSSHGSVDYLYALLDMAGREGMDRVYVHAMLGRRGERPESGAEYVEAIERRCREQKRGKLVSVIGRFWSMDREEHWDRIEKTYRMLLYGEGTRVRDGRR